MWSSVKTSALIIAVEPFKEADRKYRALTKDFGKIEFIGRGARKAKAKLASHLELFALVQLELIVGKRQTTVIGAERLEVFSQCLCTLEHRLLGQVAMGFIDKMVKPDFVDEALYEEVVGFFTFLNTIPALPPSRSTFLLGGLFLRLMRHLGYEPELDVCLSCRTGIMPLSFRWHDLKGGLVCTECFLGQAQEWFSARMIDEEIVALLRYAREAAYADLARTAIAPQPVYHFSSCVHDLLRMHVPGYLERPYWEGAHLSA